MQKIRIGVICPSEIAFRRFLPAVKKHPCFDYIGISCADESEWGGDGKPDASTLAKEREKAQTFADTYGGAVFDSYSQLLSSPDIDAVYLPLPPALHFRWGRAALENGKHVFMEKPFTTSPADTEVLISLAREKHLALHENYMFLYHSQLDFIQQALKENRIGSLRLIRIAFGFPFRGSADFRYHKSLGGGALLDCGGYTVKLASFLLGQSAQVVASHLNRGDGLDVDLFGSATICNADGLTAQLSFGMDNSYKCELEIWGSTGTLYTNRIFTAPDGYEPTVLIRTADGEQMHCLTADDSFSKSLSVFRDCVHGQSAGQAYQAILAQAHLTAAISSSQKAV